MCVIPFLFRYLRDTLYLDSSLSIRDSYYTYQTDVAGTGEVETPLQLVVHPFAPLLLQKFQRYYGFG